MNTANNLDKSVPNHAIGEEERFKTDFYDYLDTPENSSRYTIAMDAIKRLSANRSLKILDVGCGHANIANYTDDEMEYVGIDHSQIAIEYCTEKFPNHTFVTGDAQNYLENSEPFDIIICCGFLFHNVDKNTLVRNNDKLMIEKCLSRLTSQGYLVIISPFAYSDAVGFQLFDQAKWKLNNIELVLSECKGNRVWQSMALQIGAGNRAKNQTEVPDWWTPADRGGNFNRYSGTYLGSWTLILEPKD
ncbi:MAG: class I SAM-dependent methyltransferase [Bacteroidota bacterium]